jgi:deazaflavin-dependent oxidoreductase (nitroreductase family)
MYKRPGAAMKVGNALISGASRIGLSPAGAQRLTVRGRSSGELRTVPVNPLELDGDTYLVAPRGTTHWARNLRAAGEGELSLGRKTKRFTFEEIPDADKPPLLRAYLDRWGWQTKDYFEADADSSDERLREIAPDHPVFRLSF